MSDEPGRDDAVPVHDPRRMAVGHDLRRPIRRQAFSLALALLPVGFAFGVAAAEAGLAAWQASAFSLLIFAGSAQFAAVDILGDGGSVVAAVGAGLLLNLRSLTFGVLMAPALTGPWWSRAGLSHVMIDESAAVGVAQSDRALRRYGYIWSGCSLFVAWNVGTLVGTMARAAPDDLVSRLGVDAAFPAIFLALLWPRLSDNANRQTAFVGAAVALALTPVAPPGIPILAAPAAVLIGWRKP